jgi:hypothetical protein
VTDEERRATAAAPERVSIERGFKSGLQIHDSS